MGEQVDSQHPDGQEQLDRGKNGALGQRDLEAVPTLVQLATLQGRAVLVTAFRAAEPWGRSIVNRASRRCASVPQVAGDRGKLSPP